MARTSIRNEHQNIVRITNICHEDAHQKGEDDGQAHSGDGHDAGGGGGRGDDGQDGDSHFVKSGGSGEEQVESLKGGEHQHRPEQAAEQDQGVQDRPVDGTCHQEGGGGGGGVREQRVGDDGGAVKPSKRSRGWVVPRRRRGVVPSKKIPHCLSPIINDYQDNQDYRPIISKKSTDEQRKHILMIQKQIG